VTTAVTAFVPPALPASLEAQLEDLYVRGTPQNTLRAYERDLIYITAWKAAAFKSDLEWPEQQDVALRFVLDHARSFEGEAHEEVAREAAEALIEAGLRKSLACPAPSTVDRRIASWAVFHRMRNLESPFSTPLLPDPTESTSRCGQAPYQEIAEPDYPRRAR